MGTFRKVAWFVLFMHVVSAMEEKKQLTSDTFVQAVKQGDRKALLLHKSQNIGVNKEILWQLYTTRNASLRQMCLQQPFTISPSGLNKFVEEGSKKYGLHSDLFFSFVHRLVGLTGSIPTTGGFETIEFYANPFVRWYCDEMKQGISHEDFKKFPLKIKEQRERRKSWSSATFFKADYLILSALLLDDQEIKTRYFLTSRKTLTYEIFKELHPIGYLIALACVASAMGNDELMEMILSQELVPFDCEIALKQLGSEFVCESFMAHYSDFLPEDHKTKLCGAVGEYWRYPLKKKFNLDSFVKSLTTFVSIEEEKPYEQLLFLSLLKISCLYQQSNVARLLIKSADIHRDETFERVKEVIAALAQFIQTSIKYERKLYNRKLYTYIALHSQLKQYVFNERFYKKIMDKKDLFKQCTLPLIDTSDKNIVVPAEIGLRILEYCPLIYKKLELKK